MIYKKAKILGLIIFLLTYVLAWFLVSQFTDVTGIIASIAAVAGFIAAPKIQKIDSQSPNDFLVKWHFGEDAFKKIYKVLFKTSV